jgi:hypothetical protein
MMLKSAPRTRLNFRFEIVNWLALPARGPHRATELSGIYPRRRVGTHAQSTAITFGIGGPDRVSGLARRRRLQKISAANTHKLFTTRGQTKQHVGSPQTNVSIWIGASRLDAAGVQRIESSTAHSLVGAIVRIAPPRMLNKRHHRCKITAIG